MKIRVKARPKSRRERVEEMPDGSFRVEVKAPPSDGEANLAVCKLLAEYFGKPKSAVKVVLGGKNSNKVVEIDE